ncbi:caspase family protein [Actinoplanes sp. NPDC051851]|uniref:caspase family protein n=1 Tax=Actinoplanes sp. NPDC051851 TaxID=3154753 RepID=UPI00343C1510
MTTPTRRGALVIGTGRYHHPDLGDLLAPAGDAREVGQVLGDRALGGFAVTTVIDETHAGLRNAVRGFLSEHGRDDLALIYLSGHGLLDGTGNLHFAGVDTDATDPASSAVPAEWLWALLSRCDAGRQVVILDCCHAGAFGGRRSAAAPLPFRGNRGRVVLTSSHGGQVALEQRPRSGLARSVYTAALVDGLRTGAADRDGDGLVSTWDLHRHVEEALRRAGVDQNPQRSQYARGGEIYLARSPLGVQDPASRIPARLRPPKRRSFCAIFGAAAR